MPEDGKSLPGIGEILRVLGELAIDFLTALRRVAGTAAVAISRAAVAAWGQLRTVALRWSRQWVRLRDYHLGAARPWDEQDALLRRTAAAIGLRSFSVGMLLAALVAWNGGGWGPAIVVVLSEILWASARFIILALLVPPGSIDRSRLATAFLAGVLPYLLGATPALRVVALALSAALTYRGLLGAGLARRDTTRAVAWSFGGQVATVALSWAVRAVVALVVLA